MEMYDSKKFILSARKLKLWTPLKESYIPPHGFWPQFDTEFEKKKFNIWNDDKICNCGISNYFIIVQ